MACFNPLEAFQTTDGTILFRDTGKNITRSLRLACGQCVGCRLERSRQWAIRCLHEAKTHQENCFLTLTYADENIPEKNSLQYRHFQLFIKRLRRRREVKTLRYYMCGEYGEKTQRPHYHACLFGTTFKDKQYHSKTPQGNKLYESQELNELWQQGFAIIGDLTFESAAYVARYVMKKITGYNAKNHYKRINIETGEIYTIEPEFNKMSLKPAIGKTWLEKFWNDVYPNGTVITRGLEVQAPRYYDKQLEKRDPTAYAILQENRETKLITLPKGEHTTERLKARETVAIAKIKHLKRNLHEES